MTCEVSQPRHAYQLSATFLRGIGPVDTSLTFPSHPASV